MIHLYYRSAELSTLANSINVFWSSSIQHSFRSFRSFRPFRSSALFRSSPAVPLPSSSPSLPLAIAVSDSSPPLVENLVEVVLRLLKRGLKVSEFLLQIFDITFDAFFFVFKASLNHRKFLQNEPIPLCIDPLACVIEICFGLVWKVKLHTSSQRPRTP